MAESLNVIALVSGGKDSFFSIFHCIHNRHRIVALANLHPLVSSEISDLNSYMYQTVGHAIIPLYGSALGLPMYRRPISGSAVNTDRDYEPVSSSTGNPVGEDETESLLLLLDEIKSAHPEVNAVCSGAIESTYQRTRVESVAVRLGLVPLSYLWQYPTLPAPIPMKGGLLQDIAAIGLDARIVKVASAGLDETFLWGSLKDEGLRKNVERGVAKFGGSVLGEGGEYETLVVDGPSGVWKDRLEIGEQSRRVVRGEGGESWINFKAGEVVGKEDRAFKSDHWKNEIHIPNVWDAAFSTLMDMQDQLIDLAIQYATTGFIKSNIQTVWTPKQNVRRSLSIISINNVIAVDAGPSTEEQMQIIKTNLTHLLKHHQRSAEDLVFTMILLRSMADFAAVNAIYQTMFNKPNPPARVTVACGDNLPHGINVLLNLSLDVGYRHARVGLHVQSRSYWAPANIGPYSQAVVVPFAQEGSEGSIVYLAGQIPLVPASMQILTKDMSHMLDNDLALFWGQTCLALQHLWRVSKSTRVTWWAYGIAFFVGNDCKEIGRKAMLTWLAWKEMHEPRLWQMKNQPQDEEELDIWDKKHGRYTSYAIESEELRLPDFRMRQPMKDSDLGSDSNAELPAFFAVQVDELPRGCDVEWHR